MTTLGSTGKETPQMVAASNTSFVTEKDGPKSASQSEVFDDLNKENVNTTQNGSGPNLEESDVIEYPKAMKLATILVAVILAVFLVALDMVS
jgi:hypothetical protein